LKTDAAFFTDFWQGAVKFGKRKTRGGKRKRGKGYANHIERFNHTLRQRCSRLVRKRLSFSQKLENHIGAIKYFIGRYNKF
jgi:IS1 family transposase